MEWNTISENQKHAYVIGLKTTTEKQREQGRKLGKMRSKKVIQYNLDSSFIAEWESTREAERQLNICHSDIAACCRGKLKTAGGFKWEYV